MEEENVTNSTKARGRNMECLENKAKTRQNAARIRCTFGVCCMMTFQRDRYRKNKF